MSSQTKLKFLLISASCAVIAACSDASIVSPGEQNQAPAPVPGGGGGSGAASINAVPASGCPSGTGVFTASVNVDGDPVDLTACRVSGNVLSDLTLTSDGAFILSGPVFIGQDGGATAPAGTSTAGEGPTLTIPAGATIIGETGNDFLVVSRGAEIRAEGTQTNPIVFTSSADFAAARAGTPRTGADTQRGEWGGLILNGRAPINDCNAAVTGGTAECVKSGEGSSGLFGGATPTDSSGILRFVQVKYAGFRVNDEDELNGIAFQGTGSGTEVEFVQVHNNEDDGIEFFGGATNARYLVLTGIADDSLDYTDGWVGNVQYVLVDQLPDDGDNAFEFDSNGDSPDALPRSNPTIANFTLLGERESSTSDVGMVLRAGTAGTFVNGVVVDFNDNCLDVDDSATFPQAASGDLNIRSTFFDCNAQFSTDDDGFDEEAFFNGVGFPANTNNVAGVNSLSGFFPGPAELAVVAEDPSAIDPEFDAAVYAGAFSPDESETSNWALGWTFGLFAEPECPAGTSATGDVINSRRICRVSGTILSDLDLSGGSSLAYELSGPVFVGEDVGNDGSGGTSVDLTIDPGVTIFGETGNDFLVVSRGSRIFSNGTRNNPVVMTSRADFTGTLADPNSARGQWGGLIINGRAPINDCNAAVTGGTAECVKSGEGSSGLFGGAIADDDSGSLSFTRVQYAGFRVNDEDELNGIAFQGTGSATDVNFVQVHNNEDDGIEFFGGGTNAKHLVLTGIADDSLDYTDGWIGNVQFVIVQQAADDGDNAFEFDSNGDSPDALPRSNPTISNFTLIGVRASSSSDVGMVLRAGTAGTFVNGIVADFNDNCLDVDDSATFPQADAGDLSVQSTFFDCVETVSDDSDGFDEAAFFNGTGFPANTNNAAGTTSLAGFSFVTDFSTLPDGFTPNNAGGVVPSPTGPEASVTPVDPSTIDPFFDSVDYIGAVENADDDWYLGWTLQQQ